MLQTPATKTVKLTFGKSSKLVYFCDTDWETLQQRYNATGRWDVAIDIETGQKATDCKESDQENKPFEMKRSGEWCMACNGAVRIV